MRPRILSVLGVEHAKHAVAATSSRWSSSREDADWRRGGGRKGHSSMSRMSARRSLRRLASRVALVFAITGLLIFATKHSLQRRQARNENLAHGSASKLGPQRQRARARARRAFVSADPTSASDGRSASALAFRASLASSPSQSSPSAAAAAFGGELVQRSKPASLVVVVPFTFEDADKVIRGLERWARPGDPCPILRRLERDSGGSKGSSDDGKSNSSPVNLLFWFNRDLEDELYADDAATVRKVFLDALRPSLHCFGRVEFKSARLSDDEDAYPLGPSNQWYSLFLSPQRPLDGYDYIFWCEHDVVPIQPGWIDALLLEVTFRGDFYVKGSIHRGRKLDDIVLYPDDASWVTHINGNALYRANDPVFNSMISQCEEKNRGSRSFLSSFDAAMWIQHVTSFASNWEKYQGYAHKFQYTDLIQNLNEDVSWPEGARDLAARSPKTFLVHGTSASAGEAHRKKTYAKGVAVEEKKESSKSPSPKASALPSLPGESSSTAEATEEEDRLPFRPKAFPPNKVAVVVPLIASQIAKLRVLFSLSSQEAFRPCDCEKYGGKGMPNVDIIFQISSTWLDENGTKANKAHRALGSLLDEYPLFTSCFNAMDVRAANLDPSEDVHTATVFTGPNLQFRRMMNDKWLRERYSHVLLLEPDATPIKHDWLERFWLEARGSGGGGGGTEESFWIKGTAYRGFRGDWVRNPNPYNITRVSSMWAAMNGNGIYNLQDPEFFEFMDRVWEAHPALPFDAAMHAYLFDVENFEHTKRALTKIRYSSYVQNHGATRFDIATLRRESPETYIVHSSCRDEFPNKKAYCFVCDRDTPWSEDCQVKLNSYDVYLGYDRYTTGPDYRGPEISNANERELWRLNVVV